MAERREVTVYAKKSVYRARIELYTKGLFRRRDGFRFVIERRWSQIPSDMVHEEHWKVHHRGPWVATSDEAIFGADLWLNNAVALNPLDGDYL